MIRSVSYFFSFKVKHSIKTQINPIFFVQITLSLFIVKDLIRSLAVNRRQ